MLKLELVSVARLRDDANKFKKSSPRSSPCHPSNQARFQQQRPDSRSTTLDVQVEWYPQEALKLPTLIPEDTFSQKLLSESLSLHGRVGVDVMLMQITWPRLLPESDLSGLAYSVYLVLSRISHSARFPESCVVSVMRRCGRKSVD